MNTFLIINDLKYKRRLPDTHVLYTRPQRRYISHFEARIANARIYHTLSGSVKVTRHSERDSINTGYTCHSGKHVHVYVYSDLGCSSLCKITIFSKNESTTTAGSWHHVVYTKSSISQPTYFTFIIYFVHSTGCRNA